jgi:hypothetical protein
MKPAIRLLFASPFWLFVFFRKLISMKKQTTLPYQKIRDPPASKRFGSKEFSCRPTISRNKVEPEPTKKTGAGR